MGKKSEELLCSSCGAGLKPAHKFCPECGAKVPSASSSASPKFVLTLPRALLLLAVATLLSAGTFELQKSLAGTRPTKVFTNPATQQQGPIDLDKLRDDAKASPDNKEKWHALIGGLLRKAQASGKRDPKILTEIVAALGEVLKVDPKDSTALMMMGDLSFDRQAFAQAADYYSKYIEQNPTQLRVKTRFASALTFLERFGEAEKVLLDVLEVEPKNFQAHAYLTINYVQLGLVEKAKSQGQIALSHAPSEEAKKRFEGYLNSLGAKSSENSKPADDGSFEGFVRSHQILGPKLSSLKLEGEVYKLRLNQFPMSAMPPFAKEKLYSKMRERLKGKPVKAVEFIDASSDKLMETMSVTP